MLSLDVSNIQFLDLGAGLLGILILWKLHLAVMYFFLMVIKKETHEKSAIFF